MNLIALKPVPEQEKMSFFFLSKLLFVMLEPLKAHL